MRSPILPPSAFCDLLQFFTRHELERISTTCKFLSRLIEVEFQGAPFRVFHRLDICAFPPQDFHSIRNERKVAKGAYYSLYHDGARWHPTMYNNVQQFLAGEIDSVYSTPIYFSFAEMHRYLGLTVRTIETSIHVRDDISYTPEAVMELESLTNLWRNGEIRIEGRDVVLDDSIRLVLTSPTILQCKGLHMTNPNFAFSGYKVLYSPSVLKAFTSTADLNLCENWLKFFEGSDVNGNKPFFVLWGNDAIAVLIRHISHEFPRAKSRCTFKALMWKENGHSWESLTPFRIENNSTGEFLELIEAIPVEYRDHIMYWDKQYFTLERRGIEENEQRQKEIKKAKK
ncbi:hypothetical protein DdX_19550 [Ditylenchus destructor]|uniref:Uncharacterized protein n=1 Tax=Ditylenchus destructor TaxID=166010 RepID=A0AAD4MME2_9BILA|nr:hypothetical protein DdX_19550 [Ditylenchus destructor]